MGTRELIILLITSGVVSAIISGSFNYYTKITTIKEAGLYARRADVIDKFMNLICELNESMGNLLAPFKLNHESGDDQEFERRRAAGTALDNLSKYYCKHRHYLPSQTDEKMEVFIKSTKKTFSEYVWVANPVQIQEKPNVQRWAGLWENKYKNELVHTADDIAKDFRKMIGVR